MYDIFLKFIDNASKGVVSYFIEEVSEGELAVGSTRSSEGSKSKLFAKHFELIEFIQGKKAYDILYGKYSKSELDAIDEMIDRIPTPLERCLFKILINNIWLLRNVSFNKPKDGEIITCIDKDKDANKCRIDYDKARGVIMAQTINNIILTIQPESEQFNFSKDKKEILLRWPIDNKVKEGKITWHIKIEGTEDSKNWKLNNVVCNFPKYVMPTKNDWVDEIEERIFTIKLEREHFPPILQLEITLKNKTNGNEQKCIYEMPVRIPLHIRPIHADARSESFIIDEQRLDEKADEIINDMMLGRCADGAVSPYEYLEVPEDTITIIKLHQTLTASGDLFVELMKDALKQIKDILLNSVIPGIPNEDEKQALIEYIKNHGAEGEQSRWIQNFVRIVDSIWSGFKNMRFHVAVFLEECELAEDNSIRSISKDIQAYLVKPIAEKTKECSMSCRCEPEKLSLVVIYGPPALGKSMLIETIQKKMQRLSELIEVINIDVSKAFGDKDDKDRFSLITSTKIATEKVDELFQDRDKNKVWLAVMDEYDWLDSGSEDSDDKKNVRRAILKGINKKLSRHRPRLRSEDEAPTGQLTRKV